MGPKSRKKPPPDGREKKGKRHARNLPSGKNERTGPEPPCMNPSTSKGHSSQQAKKPPREKTSDGDSFFV